MESVNIIILPVGSDKNGNPTRYDLYAEGIEGAHLGYTESKVQAEACKDGILRALKVAYEKGKNDGSIS